MVGCIIAPIRQVDIPFRSYNLGLSWRISPYSPAGPGLYLLGLCPESRFSVDLFWIIFADLGLNLRHSDTTGYGRGPCRCC